MALSRLYKPNLLNRWIYFPLIAGFISLSSCSKEDSGPTNTYPPPDDGENGEYVEDNGSTDHSGELKLEVDGQKFYIRVSGEDGNKLENIVVNGDYFGNDIYGFSFEDFNHNYFSSVEYFDINNLSSINDINSHFSINESLNKLRGRKYEKRFPEDGPYPYDLSQNSNLNFLGTIPIDKLYDFYVEHDAIFQNVSNIEFMRDLTGSPELSVALEAAKFRETFIENLNNYNDIVNTVASLLGGSFEKEAYYIDIYKNKLNVLTHQTTTKGDYITLKGKTYDENSNELNGVLVSVFGPIIESTYSDEGGDYLIRFLREGFYDIEATLPGFTRGGGGKRLSFFGYTQPRCEKFDMLLMREQQLTLDTLILQPGIEGEDVYIRQAFFEGNLLYERSEPNGEFLWIGFDKDGSISAINRAFLKFNELPRNLNVKSAKLIFYGWPIENQSVSLTAYDVVEGWNESTLEWSNQPSYNNNLYKDFTLYYQPGVFTNVDITPFVSKWSNEQNNGLLLKLRDEYFRGNDYQIKFYSSDDNDSSKRPRLEIIYEH